MRPAAPAAASTKTRWRTRGTAAPGSSWATTTISREGLDTRYGNTPLLDRAGGGPPAIVYAIGGLPESRVCGIGGSGISPAPPNPGVCGGGAAPLTRASSWTGVGLVPAGAPSTQDWFSHRIPIGPSDRGSPSVIPQAKQVAGYTSLGGSLGVAEGRSLHQAESGSACFMVSRAAAEKASGWALRPTIKQRLALWTPSASGAFCWVLPGVDLRNFPEIHLDRRGQRPLRLSLRGLGLRPERRHSDELRRHLRRRRRRQGQESQFSLHLRRQQRCRSSRFCFRGDRVKKIAD